MQCAGQFRSCFEELVTKARTTSIKAIEESETSECLTEYQVGMVDYYVRFTRAVADGICMALEHDFYTNLEARSSVERKLREWSKCELSSGTATDLLLLRCLATCKAASMNTRPIRDRPDILLIAFPVGTALSADPGRALEIGFDLASVIDGSFCSQLAVGALAFAVANEGREGPVVRRTLLQLLLGNGVEPQLCEEVAGEGSFIRTSGPVVAAVQPLLFAEGRMTWTDALTSLLRNQSGPADCVRIGKPTF